MPAECVINFVLTACSCVTAQRFQNAWLVCMNRHDARVLMAAVIVEPRPKAVTSLLSQSSSRWQIQGQKGRPSPAAVPLRTARHRSIASWNCFQATVSRVCATASLVKGDSTASAELPSQSCHGPHAVVAELPISGDFSAVTRC